MCFNITTGIQVFFSHPALKSRRAKSSSQMTLVSPWMFLFIAFSSVAEHMGEMAQRNRTTSPHQLLLIKAAFKSIATRWSHFPRRKTRKEEQHYVCVRAVWHAASCKLREEVWQSGSLLSTTYFGYIYTLDPQHILYWTNKFYQLSVKSKMKMTELQLPLRKK